MEVELHPQARWDDGIPPDSDQEALPPADGGKEAWLFLAACFIIEALIWGMSVYCHWIDETNPFRLQFRVWHL